MKKLLLLFLVILTQKITAQDVIVMKNGDEMNVIVLEVASEAIKYKKHENQQGPTYTVEKVDVFMIRYENGTKDVFNSQEKAPVHPAKSSSSFPKSSFNINPLGLLQFGPIFQYETKIGSSSYLVPYFRYAYAGLATHAVWTGFEEDSELSASSAAVGIGIKILHQVITPGIMEEYWITAGPLPDMM
ncbi:hypothetical protein [Ekhidna sp.]